MPAKFLPSRSGSQTSLENKGRGAPSGYDITLVGACAQHTYYRERSGRAEANQPARRPVVRRFRWLFQRDGHVPAGGVRQSAARAPLIRFRSSNRYRPPLRPLATNRESTSHRQPSWAAFRAARLSLAPPLLPQKPPRCLKHRSRLLSLLSASLS